MTDTSRTASPASSGLTFEQMRADIADVLQESVEAIVAGENLVDLGLDSIRIMMLAERWSKFGGRIEFADLAEYPELNRWWDVVGRRLAPGSAD